MRSIRGRTDWPMFVPGMRAENEYNTTDPTTLLKLKRQEAQAMLELVRSVTPRSSEQEVMEKVVSTIRRQLGVERLLFVSLADQKLKVEYNFGFDPPQPDAGTWLQGIREATRIADGPLLAMGVEYAVPLGSNRDAPIAWMLIADFAESDAEVMNDLIFIETVGSFMIIILEKIRLFDEKKQQVRIQNERDVASRIQQDSLPSDFDLLEDLDIHGRCIAHYKVAGDFYDLVILEDDEIFVCIADAAGKGIAAAMLVANIQANLRALIETDASYYVILHRLHQAIARLTHYERFVTIFFGKINLTDNSIEYINAGHNPPFLLKTEGGMEELNKGSIPLGILPIETYEVGFASFHPGDVLFAYSDGVVEQENADKELLGAERLQHRLEEIKHLSAREIVDDILGLIEAFGAGTPNSDDISMLVVKHKGDPKTSE